MHITPFKEAHTDAVVSLWREVFPDEPAHNAPALVIRQKLQFQRELFFVGEVDANVVWTVLAGYDGHRGWLYSVAVHPRHRRRGLGTASVRHAEAALALAGCRKINLQVRRVNAAVAAFYRELGYEVEERIGMGKHITA